MSNQTFNGKKIKIKGIILWFKRKKKESQWKKYILIINFVIFISYTKCWQIYIYIHDLHVLKNVFRKWTVFKH